MIVARAIGIAALDLFEPRPSSGDGHPPPAAQEASAAFDDAPMPALHGDPGRRLHRAALIVPVLPVPTASVRLGSALRAIPGRAAAAPREGMLIARPLA
jgi:hypothetical protein